MVIILVEVWLPFGDTEYPVLLPDPIDLRLSSRKTPSPEERIMIMKNIKEALQEFDEPVIHIDNTLSGHERRVIRDMLKKTDVKFKESDENYNILVSITRQSPILGWRGTSPSIYIKKNFDDILKTGMLPTIDQIAEIFPDDILGISIIMSDGEIPFSVYWGFGGQHWISSVEDYIKRWEINVDLSPITIASLGGYPYDSRISNMLEAILKLSPYKGIEQLIILGDLSLEFEYDITKIPSLNRENISNYQELVLYKFIEDVKKNKPNIYVVGGMPKTVAKLIKLKTAKTVETVLNKIPARKKRIISVIEDLTNIYIPPMTS